MKKLRYTAALSPTFPKFSTTSLRDHREVLHAFKRVSGLPSICCLRIPSWVAVQTTRRYGGCELRLIAYLVFYEATEDGIIVHAVRHAARDPSGMPGAE